MNSKALDEWARASISILKQYGYLKNQNKIIILVSLLGIGFLFLGYHAGTSGWLHSDVNQTVSLKPITNNNYSFSTPIENSYNHTNNITIYNNIIVPEGVCP